MKKLLAALLLISPMALAGGDHRCQGGHNCNDGESSRAVAKGGDQVSVNSANGGEGGSSDSASNSNSRSKTGSSTSTSNVSVDTGDNETSAAATALYLQGCQVGASGQAEEGGFSLVLDDVVCQSLKLALYHRQALQLCASGATECKQYHHDAEHHYLEVAGDHIDDTEDTQEYAKNGMNIGIGTAGLGLAVYLLLLL